MVTIVLKSSKPANVGLSNAEIDGNFNNLNNGKAEKSGDTFTGPVTVKPPAGASTVNLDGSINQDRYVGFFENSTIRWALNAGQGNGHLYLIRYDGSGVNQDVPVYFDRNNGQAIFSSRPNFGGYVPWDSSNLPKPMQATGGVFNGPVSFTNGGAGGSDVILQLDSAGGKYRYTKYSTAGMPRWAVGLDQSPELGGNAGASWFMARYSDAGDYIDTPFSINRANGTATFAMRPQWNGGAVPWDSSNLPKPVQFTDGPFTFRNKLINGNFDFWHRGSTSSAGGFLADRWNLMTGPGTTVSQTRVALSPGVFPGAKAAWSTAISAAGDATNGVAVHTQRIEGVDALRGIITVSFAAAADVAGKSVSVNVLQSFGTGGSPSANVQVGAQKVVLGAALGPRYSLQFSLPSIAGKTLGTNGDDFLEIEFYLSGGTAYNVPAAAIGQQIGTFYIAQVQAEAGSTPTPFELRPLAAELKLCQRYYEVGNVPPVYNAGTAFPAMMFPIVFKATKRTYPTIAFASVSYYSSGVATPISSGYSAVGVNPDSASLYISSGTTNMNGLSAGFWSASSEL